MTSGASVGVGVLLARDHVADEDDRVDAGLVGGAVERDGEVTLGAALFERRGVDDRGGGLGRVRHELVADLHCDGAEALGARRVGVADRALAALDGGDDAGGALCGLAGLQRPFAVGLVGPHVGRGLRRGSR